MTQRISSHLSGLPLLWSASQPAHFFSSRSCYNAFSNLQLQSPLPRPTQHHWCFPARSRANAFCHSRLQPPHSRSAAPDWSMFAQRWQWDFDRTNPALLWFPHFFLQFFCEIPRGCQFFNILTCKSSSRYSSVHFLSAIFANRPPNSRKQRPYFGDHGSHFTRQNTGFRAWECFHPGIHTGPNCYTSKLLDDGWLTWWCGWHDAMTIVRNLEVC